MYLENRTLICLEVAKDKERFGKLGEKKLIDFCWFLKLLKFSRKKLTS